MRSRDIAGLAGVTPRALRHYHQIGLLPEPDRDRNSYRRYAIAHLIRLLRIKGLAAAGIALRDMPSFLDGRDGSADDLLDALDSQLCDQIARLEGQRRLVARLRNAAHAPAAGLDLGAPFKMLTEGRSDASTEAWREQIVLFSHLLDPDELAKLYALYERMARKPETLLALGRKFDALGPGSDDRDIADLAHEYAGYFRDIFLEFRTMLVTPKKTNVLNLIYAHAMSSINESQRKMLSMVSSLIG